MPRKTIPPVPPDVRAALAKALRQRIDRSGMTVDQVAAKAGLSRSAIYRWLNGDIDPNAGALALVERTLELEPFTLHADAKKIFKKASQSG